MFTTIIHPLRKMYCLSIHEYIVLDMIRTLSANPKYDFWCVMPMQKMADTLDIHYNTVLRAMKKLEEADLITKRRASNSDTASRVTNEWHQWFAQGTNELILAIKNNEGEVSGFVPRGSATTKMREGSTKIVEGVYQNESATTTKMVDNINKDINNNKDSNNILSKDNTEQRSEYGKPEINNMLDAIKGKLDLTGFKETQKMQRVYGNHLVNLLNKISASEFSSRFDSLSNDPFHRKNMGSLKYIYNQIKGYVPKETPITF